MPGISLITIGGELLRGRIVNTNTTAVGKLLRDNGFTLDRNVSIPDYPVIIRDVVEEEMAKSDIVLTSGGLGPTRDDLTKETLAELFDTHLKMHEPSLRSLEARFAARGRSLSERNRQQAMLPAACEAIPNPKGTAPGMLFRKEGKILISMPGVPFEMLNMMTETVIPLLKRELQEEVFLHHTLRLRKVPESKAALQVEAIQDQMAETIDIAYLPRHDGLWLELGVRTKPEGLSQAQSELKDAVALAAAAFGEQVYAEGERSVPEMLGEKLREQELTIALAESMTGGLLAAKVVSVSGSSTYFESSVTAYQVRQKIALLDIPASFFEKHDVVSAEVAEAMAAGVKKLFNTDIGLATTGLAEKDTETNRLPQVWLGFSDANGNSSRHVELYHDRNVNRERAANQALIFALEMIAKS
jgi:nicotinamide-nucleotide amidase